MEDLWRGVLIKKRERYIWNGHREVISFTLQRLIFLKFVYYGRKFYNKYIETEDTTKYIDYDKSGVRPKKSI